MNRVWLKYPLLLFALGVILKFLILVYGLEFQALDNLTRLVVLPGFLFAAVFFGIRFQEGGNASILGKAKKGMKSGMAYTVLIALFSWIFYSFLAPDYFERQNERRIERFKQVKYDQLVAKGDTLYSDKEYREAKDKYEQAVKLYPDRPLAKEQLEGIPEDSLTERGSVKERSERASEKKERPGRSYEERTVKQLRENLAKNRSLQKPFSLMTLNIFLYTALSVFASLLLALTDHLRSRWRARS